MVKKRVIDWSWVAAQARIEERTLARMGHHDLSARARGIAERAVCLANGIASHDKPAMPENRRGQALLEIDRLEKEKAPGLD